MLEIEKKISDKSFIVKLIGRLDTQTSSDLEAVFDDLIEKKLVCDTKPLILDFDNLDYVSSSGLRVLLSAQKKLKNIVLKNVKKSVQEIFEVTGLSDIFSY